MYVGRRGDSGDVIKRCHFTSHGLGGVKKGESKKKAIDSDREVH